MSMAGRPFQFPAASRHPACRLVCRSPVLWERTRLCCKSHMLMNKQRSGTSPGALTLYRCEYEPDWWSVHRPYLVVDSILGDRIVVCRKPAPASLLQTPRLPNRPRLLVPDATRDEIDIANRYGVHSDPAVSE